MVMVQKVSGADPPASSGVSSSSGMVSNQISYALSHCAFEELVTVISKVAELSVIL